MKPEVPQELLRQAEQWDELRRWERRELGKALRRLGLTYGEIREIIPVPKGTLSGWCANVQLSPKKTRAMRGRVPSQKGVPKDSQWRRRIEIEGIRNEARDFAVEHLGDHFFIAGTILYGRRDPSGATTSGIANTDPAALRLFIAWVQAFLNTQAEFRLSLHLHEGNDELAAKTYWRTELGLHNVRFTKTYIKPRGTGHRKNRVPAGECRVRVLRCADDWNRTMAWIEVCRNNVDLFRDDIVSGIATLAPGR